MVNNLRMATCDRCARSHPNLPQHGIAKTRNAQLRALRIKGCSNAGAGRQRARGPATVAEHLGRAFTCAQSSMQFGSLADLLSSICHYLHHLDWVQRVIPVHVEKLEYTHAAPPTAR